MEEENQKPEANLEQEKNIFEADRESFKKKLEMITNQLQEKEQTLQQKLAQENELKRKRETKLQAFERRIMDMTKEWQKSEDSYKTQESLKACCRTSADSADFNGLKKGFEQERQIQQDEIHSLKAQLERMTNTFQDVESTLKKELAEKEASKVPTNEQFLTYKERQSLLKDEITQFSQCK
ncbi:hypothetical protein SKAU_G00092430 [Synaphobranchus kaupii]|uniref:Uncharacterized protein n=1 Tax=Synaphobranchus kaupii TaxID=118154 RepID=A0A9Q1FWY4_SYNKA|nr:hypothetical protein SKAU_G00092430 [Synaphobranchus kaupii]